jgi:hypothetical protein
VEKILNFLDALTRWWIGRYDVKYDSVLMKVKGGELEIVKGWVEEGKIRPVVGKVLGFGDLEGIRRECGRVMDGRGGVGKVVIQLLSE